MNDLSKALRVATVDDADQLRQRWRFLHDKWQELMKKLQERQREPMP
jgi:hypothetical protein